MWADQIKAQARDGFGFLLHNQANECGYQSIMTPGSLKAYAEAVAEYGTMDWKDIVQPAIEHAAHGFVVRPHIDEFWSSSAVMGRMPMADKLRHTEAARKIYFDADGGTHPIGSRIENPDMMRTLERIRDEGAETFYSGALGEEIVADMQANGGLISMNDLSQYETVRTEPVTSFGR